MYIVGYLVPLVNRKYIQWVKMFSLNTDLDFVEGMLPQLIAESLSGNSESKVANTVFIRIKFNEITE